VGAPSLRTDNAGDGTRPGILRRWLALGLLVQAFQAAAADSPYVRSVAVTRDGDSYVCEAVLFAPVPQALAWEVLTDVDHMVDWVPNLRESRVLKREGDVAFIEQVGLAQFGFLSFTFTTERRLEMSRPVSISAVQIRGDARRYNSLLRLSPEAAGTRLAYRAEFEPGLLAALVLSREFFEHEIGEQFTAMIGEMVRRNAMNERALTPDPSPKGRGEKVNP
jgi:carbon monoxide dehydrogenase subunit G